MIEYTKEIVEFHGIFNTVIIVLLIGLIAYALNKWGL